jgi:hypothetical protein
MLALTHQSDTLVPIEPRQVSQSYVSDTANPDINQSFERLGERAL